MIEANKEDTDQLRLLFQDTQVLSLCFCGCGGPEFSTNSELVPVQTWLSPLPDEANAEVEGERVNVMLFASRERAQLELHWVGIDPREHPRLPRPDELEAELRLISYHGPTLVYDADAISLQEPPPDDTAEGV